MPRLTSKQHRLELGARIREFRRRRHLTQEGLAELAGKDRSYVAGVERGERNPTVDVIQSLAEALEVHISELFIPPGLVLVAREPDLAAEGGPDFKPAPPA